LPRIEGDAAEVLPLEFGFEHAYQGRLACPPWGIEGEDERPARTLNEPSEKFDGWTPL
jgi:hypothetical protein